jgi:hypothetical protein
MKAIFMGGTSTWESATVGGWLSSGSGIFGKYTSGRRKSLLTEACEPPTSMTGEFVDNLFGVGVVLFLSMWFMIDIKFAAFMMAGFFTCAVIHDCTSYKKAYEIWDASWVCKRCGHAWYCEEEGVAISANSLYLEGSS